MCDFENGSMCNSRKISSVVDTSVALVKQKGIIFCGESKTFLMKDRLLKPVIDTLAHVIKHLNKIPCFLFA